MEQEIIERLTRLENGLSKAKEEILTEFSVYNKNIESDNKMLRLQIEILKHNVEKCFNYKKYFDDSDNTSE